MYYYRVRNRHGCSSRVAQLNRAPCIAFIEFVSMIARADIIHCFRYSLSSFFSLCMLTLISLCLSFFFVFLREGCVLIIRVEISRTNPEVYTTRGKVRSEVSVQAASSRIIRRCKMFQNRPPYMFMHEPLMLIIVSRLCSADRGR